MNTPPPSIFTHDVRITVLLSGQAARGPHLHYVDAEGAKHPVVRNIGAPQKFILFLQLVEIRRPHQLPSGIVESA